MARPPKAQEQSTATPTLANPPKKSNIHLVTFRGQYLNGDTSGGRSGFANYETTVRMTQEMVEFNAQSIFLAVLAPVIMPQRYEDYRSLSTYHVVRTVREDGQPITNIKLLNRAELDDLVRREGLPINLAIYKDDEDLRQAILTCAKDPQTFKQVQSKLAPKLIERDMYVSEALALNAIENEGNTEDVNKVVVNRPSLDDVLETKEQLEKKAKKRKADAALAPYDTPDTDKSKKDYKGGSELMTDKLDTDEFPDGRHTIDGEPVNVGF